jgi:Tol biopolymer transport system component
MTARTSCRSRSLALTAAVVLAVASAATTSVASASMLPSTSTMLASSPLVQLVSVSTRGVQGTAASDGVVMSANGKYVAFTSDAANLVPGDQNKGRDVFVRDLSRGLTRLATLDTAGEQDNAGRAWADGLSEDGRYVIFTGEASNLVPGDTNGGSDVFVRDLRYGITTRASLTSDGAQIRDRSVGHAISGDGRYVAFTTYCGCVVAGDTFRDTNDIYVRDLKKGVTRLVSTALGGAKANESSDSAAISTNGRYVAFTSLASNLVPGDTNGAIDVFRHDLETGETIRVSLGPGGRQGVGGQTAYGSTGDTPEVSMSSDGRYVAFTSSAPLVDGPHAPNDAYVRDVKAGTTTLVSVGLGGVPKNSFDGRFAAPRLTGNGRYVAFTSYATNLVADDTNGVADGFVRDLKKGITRRVTVTETGQQANGTSGFDLSIDSAGERVAFTSVAKNIVTGDTNDDLDVFVARLKK